ncbi:DUF6281 family protein [Streptomyces sp. NBC_01142]|uniref:DUF6281 family protein n=1 Tax=Streptomyces sp. NBC_01142 TaxID=2975865 RepID=UPI002254FA17|nr:DUF6281 family protein [Streptomyces sp. NBC_01142]MCX4821882.1 DUF6281 family protein [Streptomyces sp. NBC_01142]
MNRAVRSAGLLLAATLTVPTAGCAADDSSDGGAPSCAIQFTYDGRTYRDVANVDFTVADKLGSATKPPCDDTGGQDEAEEAGTTETAYEVDGLSPKVAIAVGDTPEDAVFVVSYSGSELPPEVKRLIDGS